MRSAPSRTGPSSNSPAGSEKQNSSTERLERAYDREAKIVALDIDDREAILRILEDCPGKLLELRATLLQEHTWRRRQGLA